MTRHGPRRRQPRISDFALGAIVLVVVLLVTALAFKKEIPFRHHYTVTAVFATSNNIKPNSKVRIAGINVGKVTKVEKATIGGQPASRVKMRIDNVGLPLHTDATAKIRPRLFLEGNFFVDLSPGSPSAPLMKDGGTIPASQTAAPVQWDQLFSTLQRDTRKDLQDLLQQLASALDHGGAAAYNSSIPFWKNAYKDTAIVNNALLGTSPHDLSGYVGHQAGVSSAFAADDARLRQLISDLDTTATSFAVAHTDLSAAIGELPHTLRAGIPALSALNASFPPLRRMIVDARPAVRSSGPAIDALLPAVRQLRGLMARAELRGLTADLRPAAPALARLNRESVPLLGQVRLASSCQNEVILPWTQEKIDDPAFPTRRNVGDESTKFLPGIAGESRSGDANGQWFSILANMGPYAYPLTQQTYFLSDTPLRGVNPPKPTTRPPLRPDVPCETQQTPDLRSIPAPPPQGVKATIPPSKWGAYLKLKDRAVRWLRKQIKLDGLQKVLRVSDRLLTRADLARLVHGVSVPNLLPAPTQPPGVPLRVKPPTVHVKPPLDTLRNLFGNNDLLGRVKR
jgi:virulence factor Mce-like protein